MKITKKILKHRARQALETVKYLDISGLGIGAIEGLEVCKHLQVLDLSHNNVEEVEGINCCQHLWNINFSHNEISSLTELSKFYALGMVDLSFNNLSWKELGRIQDVIILDIHLHGNPALEKDKYYRIHVIDCLPNIWMLDGRIVTSAERNQSQHFFCDSALSSHPVRRKLAERSHSSATRQRMKAASIHGLRTSVLVSKFARNEIHSADTDLRRLSFLFEDMQADLAAIPNSFIATLSQSENFFSKMISERQKDRENCNVLLLLLLASLEYPLPYDLLTETLEITKLGSYADIDVTLLFTLERQWKIRLVSLLLSASKLDRDMCIEGSGGLYDRLYLSLYYLVSDLVKYDWKNWKRKSSTAADKAKSHKIYLSSFLRPQTAPTPNTKEALYAKRMNQSKEEHRMLLASEVVLLLSVVPSFYKYIENDASMRQMLETATNDSSLTTRIIEIAKEAREQGGDFQHVCKEISDRSVQQIERATIGIRYAAISQYLFPEPRNKFLPTNETRSEWKIILNTKNAYPKRPKSGILTSGEHLTSGRRRTYADMQRGFTINAVSMQQSTASEPKVSLGSNILLGPQNMARVIAMPEPNLALVQMNSVPAPNGSIIIQSKNEDDHYCYVDVTRLEQDTHLNCWKPQGTVGDKITLQVTDKTRKNDASLSRTPDALIFDRDFSKSSHGLRSRRSSMVSGKTSVTPRGMSSRQEMPMKSITDDSQEAEEREPFDSEKTVAGDALPSRPLSALFKEKMNLRLPVLSNDISIETDSQILFNDSVALPPSTFTDSQIPRSNSVALPLSSQTDTLDKSHLIAGSIFDSDLKFAPRSEDYTNSQSEAQIPDIAISAPDDSLKQEHLTLNAEGVAEIKMENAYGVDENANELKGIDFHDDDLANAENEQEPELQALVDDLSTMESPIKPIIKRTNASELRRRAISARQPKHAKVAETSRPESAVTRARDLRGRSKRLYRDEVDMDRPESASSFQLERTEAWRSSASSSMNITFDQKPTKFATFGFMSVPESRRQTSFHVIALRPTPPQRPSSPSHNSTTKKQHSEKGSVKESPVVVNANKDGGIKLANNWLADGRDLHEEYKKTRVYMSPHIPGYLDGVSNQYNIRNNPGSSLPLTASLTPKLDRLSSVRPSRRTTPTSMLRDYLPPGIGIPEPEVGSRFSPLSDVKQLSGRYPIVTLLRPQRK